MYPRVELVSVMSEREQRRLILMQKQDCFKLSRFRDQQIKNGTAPIMHGCDVAWDDILCWDNARPGTTVSQKCPDYINGFNRNENATRHCTEAGMWYYSEVHNNTWTNYTQCMKPSIDLRWHSAQGDRLRQLYTIGYSISLGTLLIAVVIMLCCKRLHSKSNTLHINLFLAFILRAVISFVKDALFIGNVGLEKDIRRRDDGILEFVQDDLHWECKLLFTIYMYSMSACNVWILSEALYLTMLVQRPLRTERGGVRAYVVLGWLLPVMILSPWVVVKAIYENSFCWNIQSNPYYYWIHRGPGVAVVVINLFLFLNIFRKLFMKIRHSSELGASGKAKYRKLAKFILVLIPLFGIMYLLFYVVMPQGFEDSFNVAYLYLEMAYNSFQGFLLALLFCFLNEEVHGEMKRLWYRYRYRKGDLTAFNRSFAASSYRKPPTTTTTTVTPTGSGRSIVCGAGLTHPPRSLSGEGEEEYLEGPWSGKLCRCRLAWRKFRSFSTSSDSVEKTSSVVLTELEQKRTRLQRAFSHELDDESLREVVEAGERGSESGTEWREENPGSLARREKATRSVAFLNAAKTGTAVGCPRATRVALPSAMRHSSSAASAGFNGHLVREETRVEEVEEEQDEEEDDDNLETAERTPLRSWHATSLSQNDVRNISVISMAVGKDSEAFADVARKDRLDNNRNNATVHL